MQEEKEAREADKRAREAEEAATRESEEQIKALGATTEPTAAGEKTAPASAPEEDADARMTEEQLGELAEALAVLTAKSSIQKERDELKSLLEDNLLSEAESKGRPEEADSASVAVSKRVRSMIKKIDAQLEKYDEKVGSSLNVISTNDKGQISLADLKRAMSAIKHAPPGEVIDGLGKKLDVDSDGFVVGSIH